MGSPFNRRMGFVGAYLPPPLIDYIRLFSFTRGQSNQQTIEDLLNSQRGRVPDNALLTQIVHQSMEEWVSYLEREVVSGSRERRKAFLQNVEERLIKKKILPSHIDYILSQLQDKIK
jgi:hypothetical protein